MAIDSLSEPVGPEVSAVVSLPEYITGLPAYLALTITSGRDTSYSDLRFANLLSLGGCIGIELKSSDGKLVVLHVPTPQSSDDPETSGGTLGQGESRRMLTDISPLLPDNLPDGTYRARLAYATDETKQCWSASFDIKFRSPTKAEAAWISSTVTDRNNSLPWTHWTYVQPKYPVYRGQISPENPLKLNLVLRRLFFGPESLEKADPEILKVLTEGNDSKLYAPETWALRAELYQARGDQQKYQECISQISRNTNGLQWWVRMLEAGHGGFLKTFRLGPALTR